MAGAGVATATRQTWLASGPWGFVAAAGALGLAAIGGAKLDTALDYRWPIFWLHIAAVALVGAVFVRARWDRPRLRRRPDPPRASALGIVLALAVAASFVWLFDYPFVALGDEVRNSGLNALQILQGTRKDDLRLRRARLPRVDHPDDQCGVLFASSVARR